MSRWKFILSGRWLTLSPPCRSRPTESPLQLAASNVQGRLRELLHEVPDDKGES
jgi:hypothetical protein